jgi:hypothetical protein
MDQTSSLGTEDEVSVDDSNGPDYEDHQGRMQRNAMDNRPASTMADKADVDNFYKSVWEAGLS